MQVDENWLAVLSARSTEDCIDVHPQCMTPDDIRCEVIPMMTTHVSRYAFAAGGTGTNG